MPLIPSDPLKYASPEERRKIECLDALERESVEAGEQMPELSPGFVADLMRGHVAMRAVVKDLSARVDRLESGGAASLTGQR